MIGTTEKMMEETIAFKIADDDDGWQTRHDTFMTPP